MSAVTPLVRQLYQAGSGTRERTPKTNTVSTPLAVDWSWVLNPAPTVDFKSQHTGVATSFLWDFGDTNTSTLQNPTHTYTLAGTFEDFTVRLTVNGSTFEEKTITVSDPSPAPGSLDADTLTVAEADGLTVALADTMTVV